MTNELTQRNKQLVWEFWRKLDAAKPGELTDVCRGTMAEDLAWTGFHPFNRLEGVEAVVAGWWRPLRVAFPDARRDLFILLGGCYEDKEWVSATGVLTGTFSRDWIGIPASGRPTCIRFGEFVALREGRIVEDYLLLDLPDVMRQVGRRVLPLAPAEDFWPRPFCEESILLTPQNDAASAASLRLVEAMIGGLGKYDGADASRMGQTAFWTPDMHWYGPTGIGSSRNRSEYERNHQTPFLTAFPDRKGFTHPDGGRHVARIAEGNFIASTGWPSVRATHLGEYLGVGPTGARVGMRVADWWRREGDRLVQNWVFIDLPHLFLQLGVDLFARLREERSAA